ncbi:unnamed protein product [Acanthosepion pharaonis]|uniref:Uncharacterized protein n=1 Tax=Acanthosepion pharaonis TaxID=158019 RepID=A0A812EBW7_ACAPH|nr:unnamed protein product [Sepia pharaonis]
MLRHEHIFRSALHSEKQRARTISSLLRLSISSAAKDSSERGSSEYLYYFFSIFLFKLPTLHHHIFPFFLSLIFFFVPIAIISYYVSSHFSFSPLFSHCLILKSPLPFVSFLSFFIVIYFLLTSDHTYLLFFSFFLSCSFSSDSKLDHFISHCKRKHPSGQDQWP